jgi:GNAT superfamily N-acetyltransferase
VTIAAALQLHACLWMRLIRGDRALIQIRPVRADETADVARTHVRADAETYAPIFGAKFRPVEFDQSLARWEAAVTASDVFLAAVDDEALVGFAHATETWLSALYLMATHHRQGIGARLLSATCEALSARGVSEIGFQAVAANLGAIAFYEAMGARQVGRKIEGEGDDAWEDVVFRLAIEPSAAFAGR